MKNKNRSEESERKLCFIVNPAARNGKALKTWRTLALMVRNVSHTVLFTKWEGHAVQLARETAEHNQEPLLIVAVGGDGTIHEVINGVSGFTNVLIGYIPAGSGNDFARGFNLPKSPQDNMKQIIQWVCSSGEWYDAGCYNLRNGTGGKFVNSLGAGFDAVISLKANRSPLKKWIGKGVYLYILLTELFRYQPGHLTLTLNGEKRHYHDTWFVTVSNQPFYGGGMMIAPLAVPDDGELNVLVASRLSRMKLLCIFLTVFIGKHTSFKEVDTFMAKSIVIDYDHPVPLHADGEVVGTTPVEIEIEPKGWRMVKKVVS